MPTTFTTDHHASIYKTKKEEQEENTTVNKYKHFLRQKEENSLGNLQEKCPIYFSNYCVVFLSPSASDVLRERKIATLL